MGANIIGIDFGTSSSLVAVMEDGGPELIADKSSRSVMPSLVAITRGRSILVGHDAEHEAKKYSKETLLVASLKRSMGHNKRFGWHDSSLPVQVLAALILAELKIQAEDYLGYGVNRAVIAVPANFSFAQRQFTKEAALIAGLEPVRIVNEATAALCAVRHCGEGQAVVADLGGGTFDVSAIDFGNDVLEVVATSGHDALGGDDFTSLILNRILEKAEPRFDRDCLERDPITFQRFSDVAEDTKRQLCSRETVEVSLPYVRARDGDYRNFTCTITRKQFETDCQPLIDQLEATVDKVSKEAGFLETDSRSAAPVMAPSVPAKKSWIRRIMSRPEKPKPQPRFVLLRLRKKTEDRGYG